MVQPTRPVIMKLCPQSGKDQMLSWMPDDSGYPGAVVCLGCSHGILVRKGTAHKALSATGFEGMAGTVRKHYVNRNLTRATYKKPRKKNVTTAD